MTAMTKPDHFDEHLDDLRRVKGFPAANEDSAVSVVVRFYADRGVLCTRDQARQVVRERLAAE
jgi:hypothetical protein